jgi:hypothetical protein
MAGIGDVNGDKVSDFAISSMSYNEEQYNRVFIIYGGKVD